MNKQTESTLNQQPIQRTTQIALIRKDDQRILICFRYTTDTSRLMVLRDPYLSWGD